jgi:hypothetical protein
MRKKTLSKVTVTIAPDTTMAAQAGSSEDTLRYGADNGSFYRSVRNRPTFFRDPSGLLSIDFSEFKKPTEQYRDIASFYIHYMERYWIIEKEPIEISFRYESARKRYNNFLDTYPSLVRRLKKHQIASYLGITPTQLSRLFSSSNK